jgi:AcrR family transcriptional regulator
VHERRQRVRALSPEDRREALIEATVPLLRVYGPSVSTRQIADAAGVAEGTIFGVFPDKTSLVRAAMIRACDPEQAIRSLAKIEILPKLPRPQDLRRRLVAATAVVRARLADTVGLMSALRTASFASGEGPPGEMIRARERMLDAIVEVIGPDAGLLRQPPAIAARLLLSMVFATASGSFGAAEPFDDHEIVSTLLDGLLKSGDPLC